VSAFDESTTLVLAIILVAFVVGVAVSTWVE
jgi:hypothetical protein